ncbi:MAG: DUF4382 domain-containing protein [Acidobacteriia bacterium]|nr:DUF4382 domain-containing protein [Terriglobia bacterium]
MRKPIFALALVSGLAIVVMLGCGGGSMSNSPAPTPQGSGSLVVMATDAPLCNVFSFTVTITGATLTPQGGGTPVSILPSGQTITLDFARLMDFTNALSFASVPAGTYTQLTLTLANPQLTVVDVNQNPPAPVPISTTLTTATVSIALNPAITVTSGGTVGMLIDFHMFRSVQTDASGQVTGSVNPVISVVQTSPSGTDGLGRLDDLHGIVQSVSTTASGSFTGSFTLQTRGGTGLVFTVNVTGTTEFDRVAGLSALTAGTFVDVDAMVDTSGNIVANEVDVEGAVDTQGRAAFDGVVLAVTRDSGGNATQFNLLVLEEFPEVEESIPLRSPLTVNVSALTLFVIARPGMNEAHLEFNPTTVGVGQHVVARGLFHTGTPNTLDAGIVVLRPQVVRGQFASLLGVGSDGKTGGFSLVPCSSLFGGQAIHTFTFADTEFYGVSDLNGLRTQPPIQAKGLLFYEPGQITANGISVPPPSMVMEARRVHQPNP